MRSEDERMHEWLAATMKTDAAPRLSPDFDRRLEQRLRPRRLSIAGRVIIALYAVAALALSVWAMWSAAFDWTATAAALLLPVIVLALVARVYTTVPGRITPPLGTTMMPPRM